MTVFSQNLVSKQLYAKLKKCLFKAYSIYEMNQKEFPFDFFEFQFFDKDFHNYITDENFGIDDMYVYGKVYDRDNPVLRRLTYSRFKSTLLYSPVSTTDLKNLYPLLGYDKFLEKIENYFIYLKKINKIYFNNFIDYNLFSFMETISHTLTHISPDIARTAVDIDKGDLIGVSYKKSMLLDEFSSTEITEHVFSAVDSYIKKSNFNNMELYTMLLREETSYTAKFRAIPVL